jgi:hypothetical protein
MKNFRKKVLPDQKCYHVTHGEGKYADEYVKDIGLFSSRKLAEEVVKKLKKKPGFRSYGRFTISIRVIDQVGWHAGFFDPMKGRDTR